MELYSESKVLSLLRFLILNEKSQKPLTYFAQKEFLSNASAYRMREAIIPYLKEVRLGLHKNVIVGEEYRIRFLIALLQSEYGLEVYQFDEKDSAIVNYFIENSASNLKLTSLLKKSFSFYDALLTLTWKRHHYGVTLPQSDLFNKLKQELFIYRKLSLRIKDTIPQFSLPEFDSSELDYLFLIYILANNSFASKEWSLEEIDSYSTIFETNTHFQGLFNPIKTLFAIPDSRDKELAKIIISFAKNFIFDLQAFIPEKNYFLSDQFNGDSLLKESIQKIVIKWKTNLGQDVLVNYHHLNLFCNHLEFFLKSNQPPLKLVLLSTDFITAKLFTQFMDNHFSKKYIEFYPFYILTDDFYDIRRLNPDLIVTNHHLVPFVKKEVISTVPIIDLSYNIIEDNTKHLLEYISYLNKLKFHDFLAKQVELYPGD
ncbi:helix-turn-helix domain-containing protein [Streptococcus didelphis]|uniref:Helix-turn-helix domain-containing protein n=1 Tax=Streptococcus didelphis TaxID=102886 RepID=A0ABY9LGP8_9STRE|nr:helix-turn-helix domain-containing protein [Streptococcus didelphis]WMB28009.1 helix-turn-helix domain-containing protein [Streptococcus didelphis]WMB29912.1 helix-turn-helix domain-containing protein [Streptococcus didelphis]